MSPNGMQLIALTALKQRKVHRSKSRRFFSPASLRGGNAFWNYYFFLGGGRENDVLLPQKIAFGFRLTYESRLIMVAIQDKPSHWLGRGCHHWWSRDLLRYFQEFFGTCMRFIWTHFDIFFALFATGVTKL